MSRPPRPHYTVSTTGEQPGRPDALDYLPSEYADLLELERTLSEDELGRAPTDEEGDFTTTLLELPALVAHVLAVYQDRYAGESFLSTATAMSSLVRHARRLSYTVDVGLSATGYATLTVKEGLSGTVERRLALASAPRGTIKAQDFETLSDLEVDSALNRMVPAEATRDVVLVTGSDTLQVQGTGHALRAGDVLALVADGLWQAFTVADVSEGEDGTTRITVNEGLAAELAVSSLSRAGSPPKLFARPKSTLRPFGWDADPASFPPADLKSDSSSAPTEDAVIDETDRWSWYEVWIDGLASGYDVEDVYLSTEVEDDLNDTWVVARALGASPTLEVLKVSRARTAKVSFHERRVIAYDAYEFDDSGEPTPTEKFATIDTHISGTVTALAVDDASGVTKERPDLPFPATWYAGWQLELALVTSTPNTEVLASPLLLDGVLDVIAPGRYLLFASLDDAVTQLVQVTEVELSEADQTTALTWVDVDAPPSGGWQLDDLQIYGNVSEVSHGRTVRETLGSSDGVSAFQRFTLKQPSVTMLPGEDGALADIEVRVSEVAWTLVADFWDSDPEDRHYRLEIDEESKATVVFGDGRNGAIPPAGTKNITVVYRVGIGTDGNMDVGRVNRIKKAHPLLLSAWNHRAISGGVAGSGVEDVRKQATRYIRTFDRAVSVSDYADLALLYPGVVRARARWDQSVGVILFAATAEGELPEASGELRAFLDARRDTSVSLTIRGPTRRAVYLALSIKANADYLTELVEQAARDALYGEDEDAPGLFTFGGRDLGQPAFRSEVYATILALDGVISAEITAFELLDEDAESAVSSLYDVLKVGTGEWLHLEQDNLAIAVTSEER